MLTVIPTPIGNLQDITLRALEALREADVIAAEDTRHSGILLHHHGISKPMVSFHEHNEAGKTASLVEEIAQGRKVALITDAGMPASPTPDSDWYEPAVNASFPLPYCLAPVRSSPHSPVPACPATPFISAASCP